MHRDIIYVSELLVNL